MSEGKCNTRAAHRNTKVQLLQAKLFAERYRRHLPDGVGATCLGRIVSAIDNLCAALDRMEPPADTPNA